MIVKDRQIYQVKFIHISNPKVPQGVVVIAKSYDQARDIFKEAGIEFERITSISQIAQNFLTEEIEVTFTDKTKTKPKQAKPKKAKDKE